MIGQILNGYAFRTIGSLAAHNRNNYRDYRSTYFGFSSRERNLFQFFIKPKLSIEYEPLTDPTTYIQQLLVVYGTEEPRGGWQHRYIMVKVKNTGKAIAHNCKGQLRITNRLAGDFQPPTDVKLLTWDDGSVKKDIGAVRGKERLHVVFSPAYLGHGDIVRALISVHANLYAQGAIVRAQDGLGVGDYEAILTVTSEEGAEIEGKFRIHVGDNFDQLSLSKIDS